MSKEDIIEKIKEAGVVGAGGGGFPTHVKINASIDTVIANGAECEPLLITDKYLMRAHSREIIEGLRIVMRVTGAKRAFVALKKKYTQAAKEINKVIGMSSDMEVFFLENYYPAGDEHELVYNITGKPVSEGGIPPDVNTLVINVNTLLNIYWALKDAPVTARWVTVAGELEEPYISQVPLGISAGELIDKGRPKIADYKIIAGGPMMGKIVDRSFRITKLCGGIIVLPEDHPAIVKRSVGISVQLRRGKSMCDQCFDCTITCPRHLLGHDLSPHMFMRNLFITPGSSMVHFTNAYLCSECGLCNMFACPLGLSPRALLVDTKIRLKEQKIKNPHRRSLVRVHSERDFRRVNTDKLMVRMGIKKYELHDYRFIDITTDEVIINMSQHAGSPAEPVVKEGQEIKAGDPVGRIPGDLTGAHVHSSISGKVTKVSKDFVTVTA